MSERDATFAKITCLIEIHVEGFDEIRRSSIFVIFANIFKIIFSFDSVFAHKVPKNCHGSLKSVWHYLNSTVPFRVYIKISDKIVS